jgi:hypothetical protein
VNNGECMKPSKLDSTNGSVQFMNNNSIYYYTMNEAQEIDAATVGIKKISAICLNSPC